MIFSYLFQQPLLFLVWLIAIIYAITIHEFSHALAALGLGDRTAKYEGRLTLNPMAHLDLLGFVVLLFAGFGWGKPVTYNPYNLKYQRYGPAVISLAGPFSNFISMLVFGFLLKLLVATGTVATDNMLAVFLAALVQINLILGLFNLIPIPPLDGSKLLFAILPPMAEGFKASFEHYGPIFLLGLIIIDNLLGIGIFYAIFGSVSNLVFRIFG